MYTFNYKDELYHHGVLGMKWGVRRYQSYSENPKLSRRKIDKMSSKKLAKKLKKQVRKQKREINGSRYDHRATGKYSAEVIKKYEQLSKDYKNSEKYKKAKSEYDALEKKYGVHDPDDWGDIMVGMSEKQEKALDDKLQQLWSEMETPSVSRGSWYITKNGSEYASNVLARKEIANARLRDLGYNKEDSEYIMKKLGNIAFDV